MMVVKLVPPAGSIPISIMALLVAADVAQLVTLISIPKLSSVLFAAVTSVVQEPQLGAAPGVMLVPQPAAGLVEVTLEMTLVHAFLALNSITYSAKMPEAFQVTPMLPPLGVTGRPVTPVSM